MSWTEKIKQGMELIKEGCVENEEWTNCNDCPFDAYCQILIGKAFSDRDEDFDAYQPMHWFEESEEESNE